MLIRYPTNTTMRILAEAFVELACYLEIAKFEDPDEAQGAKEVVGRCLVNATPEELAMIAGAAREMAKLAAAKGLPANHIKFYQGISHWTKPS